MHRYSPGPWFAAVTHGGIVVLPASVGEDVAIRTLDTLARGGGFPEVLEILAAGGFANVPPFGFVGVEPSVLRLVLRGDIEALIEGERVTAASASTWIERVLPVTDAVELRAPHAEREAAAMLPVSHALVLCSRVSLGDGSSASAPDEVPAVQTEARAAASDDFATLIPDATVVEVAREDSPVPEGADVHDAAPAVEADDHADGGDYDELFGATVFRSVEDAAVRVDDDQAVETVDPEGPMRPAPTLEAAGQSEESSAPASGGPQAPVPIPQPEPTSDGGLISGVPMHLTGDGPDRAIASSPPGPPEGDHDGLTVSVAQLRAMRGASESSAQSPTPARATVSSGAVVTLDRSAVIGRRPRAVRATGDLPHLVTVDSPTQDISRSHLELRVQGGAVLAVDLDTTNGTVLARAGNDPVRLHPQEPTILLNGDRLELGDGVTVTIEGLS